MNMWSSRWLHLGEWLLHRRWWWITLASLSVFLFEFLEYQPFQRGVEMAFFFEIIFYGITLPLSTGLALSWLAASRAELLWTEYYQELIPNLGLQLHAVHTNDELAKVYLQFVRVMLPVIGVMMYKYQKESTRHEVILNWALETNRSLLDAKTACATEMCPFLHRSDISQGVWTLHSCRDPNSTIDAENSPIFCVPFLFSNSLVAGARLYFPAGKSPSVEQARLLKEIAPAIASTFQRVHLESVMKRQEDKLTVEQQRMARDVHDTLGHSLAYLRLRLDQISMEFQRTETNIIHKEVEGLRDIAKEAYDQMREVLSTLAPETNSEISTRLKNYADKISQRSDFRVQVHQQGQPRVLPALLQRNIFYIFQETLTNIEKHAHARLVDVALNWQTESLKMSVIDDGVGFDSSGRIPDGHFGLNNMNERARESNAELCIESQPGMGTQVVLDIPYEEAS